MAENKKSNQADAYMESMKAYQKTYDFLLYLYPILSQFPKFEKFALQSQIKTAVFELPPEEFNRKYESRKGHLGHADTYHIAKAVEYELLFYEWERLEATA